MSNNNKIANNSIRTNPIKSINPQEENNGLNGQKATSGKARFNTKDEQIQFLETKLRERNLESKSLREQLAYFNTFFELPEEGESGNKKNVDFLRGENEELRANLNELQLQYETLIRLNKFDNANEKQVQNEQLIANLIQKNESLRDQIDGFKENSATNGLFNKDSESQKFKETLNQVRLERQKAVATGAQERLMARVADLDNELDASHKANFKLKIALFLLSAGMIGYFAYNNLALIQESARGFLQSMDKTKVQAAQDFLKANFISFVHGLNNECTKLVELINKLDVNLFDRSDFILIALRNASLTALGVFILLFAVNNIKNIARKIYDWRVAINLMIAIGLVVYFSGIRK